MPYFENRQNISGDAGISGNNQDPTNWGPPALTFTSGIEILSDQQSAFNRNRTDAFSGSIALYRGRHNITIGGNLRKQQYNDFFQQDPRGIFTFTGAATQGTAGGVTTGGSDLADFLIGVPDTSSIAFGNADKYLRQPVYDAYATDDWRILTNLTINAGLRWDYGAPMTEIHGRLVNLDVAPGFTAVKPVLATDPVGPLTGSHYPSSLIRPDKRGFEPRVGISWRPIPASTIVVRAGYGIYDDTSVYQTPVLLLAQQAPLSKSLSVQDSPSCRLTLAYGFEPCPSTTENTFAVDPNFRVGYAQTWQLGIQRDLPGALQMTATYLGVKGTRGVQQYLPTPTPSEQSAPVLTAPRGLRIRLRAVTPRANRASFNCAAGCAAASPRRCSTLIRNRLTMTQAWAAWVTSAPAAKARRHPPAGRIGQGSGQGSGGGTTSDHAKRVDTTGHRAELAQPAC